MSENKEYLLGLAKAKENNFKKAIEHFSNAIEKEPNKSEFFGQRSICYMNLEQFELSMFDMNKAIELDPKYAYRYTCRAFLKTRLGDLKGALNDYEKSIELEPDNPITYNNMGLAQQQLGYNKEAEDSFEKSNSLVGYNPKNREIKSENNYATNKETEDKTVSEQAVEQPNRKAVLKEVFTKKSTFKEFLGFIKNGFKLKDDE
jgi:Flp pilus assembly protein TadD